MSTIVGEYRDHVAKYVFPYLDSEHEYRYLTVERRGRLSEDRWAILDAGYCYQPKGRRWTYERSNSSRTDKFLKASRMPLEEALPLAERLAEGKAMEWQRVLARRIARQEAAEAAEKAQEGS